MHLLDHRLWFPSPTEADSDGLLAIGGDLNMERLLLAYRSGIFPWYTSHIPLWWCPDPRFVLFPRKLLVGKRLRKLVNGNSFSFTHNQSFEKVISHCASIPRQGQDSTWITHEMTEAYIQLHHAGYAHSFEVWQHGQLVGGLYGVWLGHVFSGESMFSLAPNGSKVAFVHAVQMLQRNGVQLIDCQVHTEYLTGFGAEMISRNDFLQRLSCLVQPATSFSAKGLI